MYLDYSMLDVSVKLMINYYSLYRSIHLTYYSFLLLERMRDSRARRQLNEQSSIEVSEGLSDSNYRRFRHSAASLCFLPTNP